MKLYVKCCKSSNSGKLYRALFADFGYRTALVTMDTTTLCDFLDVSPSTLGAMKEDETMHVGTIVRGK